MSCADTLAGLKPKRQAVLILHDEIRTLRQRVEPQPVEDYVWADGLVEAALRPTRLRRAVLPRNLRCGARTKICGSLLHRRAARGRVTDTGD
jgi:hypothetical protein